MIKKGGEGGRVIEKRKRIKNRYTRKKRRERRSKRRKVWEDERD